VTDQVGKQVPPTDDDWREAIDAFKRYREFDTAKYRDNAADLIAALKHEATQADASATRIEHEYRRQFQPHEFLDHDGGTLTNQFVVDGYAKQLDLARLDLLRLDPIDPWLEQADPYGVMPHVPAPLALMHDVGVDELSVIAERHADHMQRWGLGLTSQRPVRLLRLQAERLLEGAARVQRYVDHYKSRLKTIKRYSETTNISVATHDLLWAAEPWNVDVSDIADRLVAAKVLPTRESDHDDLHVQWCSSLGRARRKWRKAWKRRAK
jgi:hypothetical protein